MVIINGGIAVLITSHLWCLVSPPDYDSVTIRLNEGNEDRMIMSQAYLQAKSVSTKRGLHFGHLQL